VRTKAFVISLLIMPLMMGGSVLMQWLLRDFRDLKDKHFAVVDRTPGARLYPAIQAAVGEYEKGVVDPGTNKQVKPHFIVGPVEPSEPIEDLRAQLSERVRKGELFGFLEVGPGVFEMPPPARSGKESVSVDGGPTRPGDDPRAVRYQSNRPTHQVFPELARRAINNKVHEGRFAREGLKPPAGLTVGEFVEPVRVESRGLSTRDREGKVQEATPQSQYAPLAVPIGLMFLMYMVVMMGATPLMQGVVEEKMQRIAEVLVGCVRPFELMTGKLMGMTGVSLTITAVYLGGAYWSAQRYGFAEYVGGGLLAWFFVFQALAALMYGALFIAVGAACTDMKETQNLMWPILLLATLPMFVLGSVLQEPNSGPVTALSFFPFATPMLMIARQAVPPGPPHWWQPALGAALVLATTVACVYAAGRIFRVGLLMQGKGARLGEMVKWVLRG
jgi:ABC-2 type transport system permease protein